MEYYGPFADQLEQVVTAVGLSKDSTKSSIELHGDLPNLGSPHQVSLAGALSLLAQGVAAASLHEHRGGDSQIVRLQAEAIPSSLNPFSFIRRNGVRAFDVNEARPPVGGFFRTQDDRQFYITAAFPRLADGALRVLNCVNDRGEIQAAIARWNSDDLESAFIDAKLTGAKVLTPEEWAGHPQAASLRVRPLVEIERVGDGDPIPLPPSVRPLGGVRVCDVTRVFAGPMLSRGLAENGADVLHLGPLNPRLMDPGAMTLATGIGKRTAALNFSDRGAEVLAGVLRDADVLVQSWRPGVLGKYGFSPEQSAAIRPGIIYVSVNCYGLDGPWGGRGGFDPLALASTGMLHTEWLATGEHKLTPPGILTDGIAAFLGAAAVMSTLMRRATEGGSWHIKLTLARIAMWIQQLGLGPSRSADVVPEPSAWSMESPFGTIEYVPPALDFSRTRAHFARPPAPIGAHLAEWTPR